MPGGELDERVRHAPVEIRPESLLDGGGHQVVRPRMRVEVDLAGGRERESERSAERGHCACIPNQAFPVVRIGATIRR